MEKELWIKYQHMIDAGLTEFIVDSLVKEITDNLTPEQLKPLGDLRGNLLKIQPSSCGITAKVIIKQVIELARKGHIKEQ